MSDSSVPLGDLGVRFPEVMSLRLPAGFLDRIRVAAIAEGIAPPDFARRAIAERLARVASPTETAPGGTRDTETPERHEHGQERPGTP